MPLLGEVPLEPGLAERADRGEPVLVGAPGSPAAQALLVIAEAVHREASKRGVTLPAIS